MAPKADRKPTWTSKITRALADTDDFMSLPQIIAATGATGNQARAALFALKKMRVVDALEAEEVLWWFLTGDDMRSRTVEERAPEPEGNRTRIGGAKRIRTAKPKY